jgi:hypothetical protein
VRPLRPEPDAQERKLEKVVEVLKAQAWELIALADELEGESRARA